MRRLAAGIGSVLLATSAPGAPPREEAAAAGLAARLSPAAAASEHWDLTARFESGHRLFARFLVTNQGPGTRTAVASLHLVLPDGTPRSFHWGRRQGAWSADAGGLRLKVGSPILDLRGPRRRLEIDSAGKGLRLDLEFAAQPSRVDARQGEPGVAVVAPAPVAGRLSLAGGAAVPLRGALFLRHAWSDTAEVQVAARWVDVLAGNDAAGFALWDLLTPDGDSRGGAAPGRDAAPALPDGPLAMAAEGAAGPEPERYPTPRRLRVRGDGVTGEVVLGREILRMDPMRVIPQPFRWWLSRQSAPRRSWHEAVLRLHTVGSPPTLLFEGDAVVAVTWLDPVP